MAEVIVTKEFEGIKIERFIKRLYPAFPMSLIFKLMRKGKVRVNKRHVENGFRLQEGDQVILHISPELLSNGMEIAKGEAIYNLSASDIIFENEIFLAINKPAGFAVHGGEGHSDDVILKGVYKYLGYSNSSLKFAPTPVHRLDIDTSGILIFAKNYEFLRAFNELQRLRKIHKEYLTLVGGEFCQREMKINLRVIRRDRPSKMAIEKEGETIVHHISSSDKFLSEIGIFSLLGVEIKTGRTHQIRSHLMQAGFPIIGDSLYGDNRINIWARKRLGLKRQFLHSSGMRFVYEGITFDLRAYMPEDLLGVLEILDIEFSI